MPEKRCLRKLGLDMACERSVHPLSDLADLQTPPGKSSASEEAQLASGEPFPTGRAGPLSLEAARWPHLEAAQDAGARPRGCTRQGRRRARSSPSSEMTDRGRLKTACPQGHPPARPRQSGWLQRSPCTCANRTRPHENREAVRTNTRINHLASLKGWLHLLHGDKGSLEGGGEEQTGHCMKCKVLNK